ncbi:hypothetical protein [Bradyrhizobium sp. JR18.2]|uniref:ATP-dependent DNA ligase n=1 Tax=Bradyrhizobium sp. JR18.2 TaxID=3156369 RepID=UPI003391BD40
MDGEIAVVVNERTDFSALHADLTAGRVARLLFYAFDLVYLDGYDLRREPLLERKRLLRNLFDRANLKAPALSRWSGRWRRCCAHSGTPRPPPPGGARCPCW